MKDDTASQLQGAPELLDVGGHSVLKKQCSQELNQIRRVSNPNPNPKNREVRNRRRRELLRFPPSSGERSFVSRRYLPLEGRVSGDSIST